MLAALTGALSLAFSSSQETQDAGPTPPAAPAPQAAPAQPAQAPTQRPESLRPRDGADPSAPVPELVLERRLRAIQGKFNVACSRLRLNVVRLVIERAEGPPGALAPSPAGAAAPLSIEASGLLLDPQGHVVTVGSEIATAMRVAVRFAPGAPVRPRRARVLGVDLESDVGLLDIGPVTGVQEGELEITPTPAETAPRFVFMMSSATSPDQVVSCGILGGVLHDERLGERRYPQLVCITMASHPQSAGGVVAQEDGRVVAMLLAPRAESDGEPRSLALPAQVLRNGVQRVLRGDGVAPPPPPERAWAGFSASDLADGVLLTWLRKSGRRGGVVVNEVFEASPALAAHLEPSDVIVAWDGRPIASVDDLSGALASTAPGRTVNCECYHLFEKRSLELKLAGW